MILHFFEALLRRIIVFLNNCSHIYTKMVSFVPRILHISVLYVKIVTYEKHKKHQTLFTYSFFAFYGSSRATIFFSLLSVISYHLVVTRITFFTTLSFFFGCQIYQLFDSLSLYFHFFSLLFSRFVSFDLILLYLFLITYCLFLFLCQ